MNQYRIVYNCGPLICIRIPVKLDKFSDYRFSGKWSDCLKGLTTVMRSHDLRQQDITSIDAEIDQGRAALAFAGQDYLAPFWLYDWTGSEFVLIRKGES